MHALVSVMGEVKVRLGDEKLKGDKMVKVTGEVNMTVYRSEVSSPR